MSTSKTLAALAAPIAGALAATAAAPAVGQTSADRFSGTAAGFVVAQRGLDRSEVAPGENATNTFVGPMSAIPGSPVTSTSPDGSADASTSPGVNRVFADSRGDPLGAGLPDILHYSGSYWGDVFTFTGGLGPLTIQLDYDFDGVVNDARGDSRLGAGPPSRPLIEDGANTGETAVRFRSYVGGFNGNRNLNPSVEGPDFFLNLATDQNDGNTFDATFDVPSIDNFDAGNGLNDDGSLDNITFAPADPSPAFDPDDPNDPELIAGPYATNDDGPLRLYGSGARFDWTYGTPLAVGLLLEAWATGGAVADFSGTGMLTNIGVPLGTVVTSESGALYPVTFESPVPEPASLAVVGLVGGASLVRRRCRVGRAD